MFLSVDGGRSRNSKRRHLPGARRRRFLALMVGAPGPPALAHPKGLPSTFLSIDGGRSWTSSSDTSRGPAVDVS
jgi:hypothetical protein